MTRYHCKGGRVMKEKREFHIALVLVGLVGVNFFWIFEVFFRGLGDALFRWHGGDVIDWLTVIFVILANVVALVGLFYLVRPRASGSTQQQGYRV